MTTASNDIQAKKHYEILDGLRGVAALIVLVFHVFDVSDKLLIPHGYLAVDLFFVLSGFVIGYAYDDRWQKGLTTGRFFKRRLIRLHPMVIAGALIGCLSFIIGGGTTWGGQSVAWYWVLLATVCSMLLIPAVPALPTDVRASTELFPLNGPLWSLFFEYIGNILYAFLLRRLSKKALAAIAGISGACLLYAAITHGNVSIGWSLINGGWWIGFVRMLFPYSVGMLIARGFRPIKLKHSFLWCSLAIILISFIPFLGGETNTWINGLYEFFCVAVLFPIIVIIGASDDSTSATTLKVSRSLGELSYPLYAIHYPIMCLLFNYFGYTGSGPVAYSLAFEHWPASLGAVALSIVLAVLLMKFYDRPVRKRLGELFN